MSCLNVFFTLAHAPLPAQWLALGSASILSIRLGHCRSELQASHGVTAQQQQQQQQQQQLDGAARLQQQLSGGTFSGIEALLSHWQQLDDARKLQYAQMAALTR
jgi:hypothetical protein